MAADPAELAALTRKLRGKGLSDAQVSESLRGLGFTKAQADGAVGDNKPPTPAAKPAPTARPAGGVTPQLPAGGSAPAIPTPDLSKLSLTPPKRVNAGDLGGFVAGLVIYTLALNFLRYGKPGVSGWMRAKFLNQTSDVGTKTSTGEPGRGGKGDALTNDDLTSTKVQVT